MFVGVGAEGGAGAEDGAGPASVPGSRLVRLSAERLPHPTTAAITAAHITMRAPIMRTRTTWLTKATTASLWEAGITAAVRTMAVAPIMVEHTRAVALEHMRVAAAAT